MGPPENLGGAGRDWHRDLAPNNNSNQFGVRFQISRFVDCSSATRRATSNSTLWRNGFRAGALDELTRKHAGDP